MASVRVERAIRGADRIAEADRRKAERLEVELAPLAAKAAKAEKAARAQAVLPSAAVRDKVMRYESHLNKQLVQAPHLLERLQATRAGNPPAPPVAPDVTVEAGACPPRPAECWRMRALGSFGRIALLIPQPDKT